MKNYNVRYLFGEFVNFLLKPSISEVEGSGTLSTKIFWSFVAIPKMKFSLIAEKLFYESADFD